MKINDFDFKVFEDYRRNFNGAARGSFVNNEAVLRFWEEAKNAYLYKLLGNELDISKTVTYNQSDDDIYEAMGDLRRKNMDFCDLYRDLVSYADPYVVNLTSSVKYDLYTLISYSTITHGSIDFLSKKIYLKNRCGHSLSLMNGEKIMRAIKKVCDFIGEVYLNEGEEFYRENHCDKLTSLFEAFRLGHSMILNQKKLKGELHLSIHPMDFATASDNANNWSSCMSWMDSGCYRMGTVEMMNSPMVICAYLASDNNKLEFSRYNTWNSKKWRAWVIVNKDGIFLNKQYPCHNETFTDIVIDWVTELAKKNLGWEYSEKAKPLSEIEGLRLTTSLMYNDTYGIENRAKCFAKLAYHPKGELLINFSGEANCMQCGELLNDSEADTLVCAYCRGGEVCDCCGDSICDDGIYWYDGIPYCETCYYDNFSTCDVCGEPVPNEQADVIGLQLNNALALKMYDNLPKDEQNSYGVESYFYKDYWNNKRRFSLASEQSICTCKACSAEYQTNAPFFIPGTVTLYKDDTPVEVYNPIIPQNISKEILYAFDLNGRYRNRVPAIKKIMNELYNNYAEEMAEAAKEEGYSLLREMPEPLYSNVE